MRTSEQTNEIAAALAKAQAEFPPITRNQTVHVRSEKGNYDFTYATLDHILELTKAARTKHELALSWGCEQVEAGLLLSCRLMHGGQWIESAMLVPYGAADKDQTLGSRLTYRKRYLVDQVLGISASDDDDANIADGNQFESGKRAVTPPPASPAPPAASPKAPSKAAEALNRWGAQIAACADRASLEALWKAVPRAEMTLGVKREFEARAKNLAHNEAIDADLDQSLGGSEDEFGPPDKPDAKPLVNWRGRTLEEWSAETEEQRRAAGDILAADIERMVAELVAGKCLRVDLVDLTNERMKALIARYPCRPKIADLWQASALLGSTMAALTKELVAKKKEASK